MKKILFLIAFISISYSQEPLASNLNASYSICLTSDWEYTTGYHSDGTSAQIRYTLDYSGYIDDIQIGFNGSWYNTSVSYDGGRMYAKNPNNKRYYF